MKKTYAILISLLLVMFVIGCAPAPVQDAGDEVQDDVMDDGAMEDDSSLNDVESELDDFEADLDAEDLEDLGSEFDV